ncbi:MAG: alpha/beta fold hydrolase [Anaerolineales bacterium]
MFGYRGEYLELTDAERSRLGGQYVRLSEGVTHYEMSGSDDAPTVVLVHGFSVPLFIWDPTSQALTEAGFRVLRYDLFGRGFSDRPRGRYDLRRFVRQLYELLEALSLPEIALIGLSMGGPIVAGFAAAHPKQVRRLVLIDVAGARSLQLPWHLHLGLIPGVGEIALALSGGERLVRGAASDFFDPRWVREFQERYRIQMRYRGFLRALLSTVRSGMLGDFSHLYRQIGMLSLPVLVLWGRQDTTVPYAHALELQRLIPQARLVTIEGCGHIPHYEKPEMVNPILIEFLR